MNAYCEYTAWSPWRRKACDASSSTSLLPLPSTIWSAFTCSATTSRAVNSRQELESGLIARAIQPLLSGDSAHPVLSCVVEEVSRQDDSLLDELERLVREKRRALDRADRK